MWTQASLSSTFGYGFLRRDRSATDTVFRLSYSHLCSPVAARGSHTPIVSSCPTDGVLPPLVSEPLSSRTVARSYMDMEHTFRLVSTRTTCYTLSVVLTIATLLLHFDRTVYFSVECTLYLVHCLLSKLFYSCTRDGLCKTFFSDTPFYAFCNHRHHHDHMDIRQDSFVLGHKCFYFFFFLSCRRGGIFVR